MPGPMRRSRRSRARGVTAFTDTPPAMATKSSTVVSARSRPRPMVISWSAVRDISLIRCEQTRTVRPCSARDPSRLRIHSTPSGSRPLTGSSRMRVAGSPSSAAAMPRRWPMPSEKPLIRLWATVFSPAGSRTCSTRPRGMPWVWASAMRWLKAVRPGWTERASRSAPTSVSGALCAAYARPSIVERPRVGASRPSSMRMVVDFPAPFGPGNPVTMPGRTVKSRPRTTAVSPYLLVSSYALVTRSTLRRGRAAGVGPRAGCGGGG